MEAARAAFEDLAAANVTCGCTAALLAPKAWTPPGGQRVPWPGAGPAACGACVACVRAALLARGHAAAAVNRALKEVSLRENGGAFGGVCVVPASRPPASPYGAPHNERVLLPLALLTGAGLAPQRRVAAGSAASGPAAAALAPVRATAERRRSRRSRDVQEAGVDDGAAARGGGANDAGGAAAAMAMRAPPQVAHAPHRARGHQQARQTAAEGNASHRASEAHTESDHGGADVCGVDDDALDGGDGGGDDASQPPSCFQVYDHSTDGDAASCDAALHAAAPKPEAPHEAAQPAVPLPAMAVAAPDARPLLPLQLPQLLASSGAGAHGCGSVRPERGDDAPHDAALPAAKAARAEVMGSPPSFASLQPAALLRAAAAAAPPRPVGFAAAAAAPLLQPPPPPLSFGAERAFAAAMADTAMLPLARCRACFAELALEQLRMLWPCGHRCVCAACAAALLALPADTAARTCPRCSAPVSGAARVFDD
jgi:hypothetical protein